MTPNYRIASRDEKCDCSVTTPADISIKRRALPRVNSFVTKQTNADGDTIRVLNVFVPTANEDDAYNQAEKKGKGARPDKHHPHVKRGDTSDREYFWHYHPGNHILFYENGIHVNYHFMWEDKAHQRQYG